MASVFELKEFAVTSFAKAMSAKQTPVAETSFRYGAGKNLPVRPKLIRVGGKLSVCAARAKFRFELFSKYTDFTGAF